MHILNASSQHEGVRLASGLREKHQQHAKLTTVIWFSVRYKDVVNFSTSFSKLLLQATKIQLPELLMGGIYQGCLVLPKDKEAIVSGSILKPASYAESRETDLVPGILDMSDPLLFDESSCP